MNCIHAMAYGGRLGLSGYSKLKLNDFDYSCIQKKELSILGARNAVKRDFEEVLDMFIYNDIPVEKIITDEYNWLDAPRAFADFDQKAGDMLKVILNFQGD